MNQKQRLRCEMLLERGKRRYMLAAGVRAVIVSIAAAALAAILVRAWRPGEAGRDPSGGVVPLVAVFVSTMIGTCAGVCIGAMRAWDRMEKEFAAQADDNAGDAT
jgi:hypothetical protein